MNPISKDDIRYKEAEIRVKKIKSFYVFAFVYFAVNIFIMFINYKELKPGETIWHLKYFSLPIFWGIGLIGYAINVFVPGVILGSNWEEKKIKKLMEKEKESQNKD
ncbi:histidine kinase [Chryseobacterium shandongense]|uniref:Histidine kinase n=1 Tax=Chryseobacterium shandongense TaxID=1493872 RepID=A0AAD0YFE0_9FLAO|nr:2TM domain-containing protein [Chryseobacterium shandongense]AZA87534.1 histidine kinase [Chryseobacterium shandongense]AZA96035.1 histidine kinase [Chryseobacterium shandongense]